MNAPHTPPAPELVSKMPRVGTTIFTVMSALAAERGAVNLGQGFPDFDCDPTLVGHVHAAMSAGLNQYPPMAGVPALREAVAAKVERLYGRRYDPATEVTVTAGATQAILTAILCAVHPGDEVIVLEPCYDSYVPNVELAGGRVVRVPLTPRTFRPDFDRIAAALSPRTRMIVVNSPHNPSATVWTREEMQRLEALLAPTDVLVVSDEVYEHMVFDGGQHVSASSLPGLAARSFVVSSFGKTYHVTGWKTGYVVAPPALSAELRKVHQYVNFCGVTPLQCALADFMAEHPEHIDELPGFYQAKRDLFCGLLEGSRLRFTPTAGTYFQLVDYSQIRPDLNDVDMAMWLTREHGVATIPVSVFYQQPIPEQRLVRLCFAKREETLRQAAEKLCAI